MTRTIRVAVIDDHHLVRAGIVALLRDVSDFEVVAEGADGTAALRVVESLHPDVLLLDLAMPGISGLDALALIHGIDGAVKVIMLSMHASEEHVIGALQKGANGYLLKDAAPTEMEQAVRAVLAGETWLSRPLSGQFISGYVDRSARPAAPLLTARQTEVLKLIASGQSTREISQILGLSVKTVETYRTQIMGRLCIFDVAGLVKYAIRERLITL